MTTALVCIALQGLLVFGLGLAVSMTRARTQRVIGYPEEADDRLHQLVRAHGNATEYGPMLALFCYVLGALGPAPWVVSTMIAVTAARFLHAAGMLAGPLDKPHPLRFLGSLVTYLGGFALVVAVFLSL